jgi:hypothetical protein
LWHCSAEPGTQRPSCNVQRPSLRQLEDATQSAVELATQPLSPGVHWPSTLHSLDFLQSAAALAAEATHRPPTAVQLPPPEHSRDFLQSSSDRAMHFPARYEHQPRIAQSSERRQSWSPVKMHLPPLAVHAP